MDSIPFSASTTSRSIAQLQSQTCLACWRVVMAAKPIMLCPSCEIRQQRRTARASDHTPHDLLMGEALWESRNHYTLDDLQALWRMFYRLTSNPTSAGYHNAALLYARRVVTEMMLPYHHFEERVSIIGPADEEAPFLVGVAK